MQTVTRPDFAHASQLITASLEVLLEKLRWDETLPTLEERFRQHTKDDSHHGYCTLKKDAAQGQALEHSNFIPLPLQILDQYRNVECASFMGLIPEIHRYLTIMYSSAADVLTDTLTIERCDTSHSKIINYLPCFTLSMILLNISLNIAFKQSPMILM